MVFRLHDHDVSFPDRRLADDDGLLAIGGDLSLKRLLEAYTHGIFPWYTEGEPICWYSPHERFILLPAEIIISKSMRKLLREGVFSVTFNQAFEEVIARCATNSRKD